MFCAPPKRKEMKTFSNFHLFPLHFLYSHCLLLSFQLFVFQMHQLRAVMRSVSHSFFFYSHVVIVKKVAKPQHSCTTHIKRKLKLITKFYCLVSVRKPSPSMMMECVWFTYFSDELVHLYKTMTLCTNLTKVWFGCCIFNHFISKTVWAKLWQ